MNDYATGAEARRAKLIATLVRKLHRTEQKLHALTFGEVDAVMHPQGMAHLMQSAQEQLRHNKERLNAILRSISDAVIAIDGNQRVEMFNRQAERLVGCSEESARNVPLSEVCRIVAEEPGASSSQMGTCTAQAHEAMHYLGPRILINRHGDEVPVTISAATIRDAPGVLSGMVLVLHDQTEERRAQRELLQARAFAENIVATIRHPLLVLDGEMRAVSANRAFYAHFKVEPADTVGRMLYELGNGAWNSAALDERLHEVITDNAQLDDLETTHEFEHIGRRTMRLSARRIPAHSSLGVLILLAIEDMTEHRRLEEQVLQGQKLRAIGQLAGGVAHDFNNILAVVLGNLELTLAEAELSGIAQHSLLEIRKAAMRGKSLVQQVLAFTRQQPQQRRVVALGPIIQEVVAMLRPTFPANVKVRVVMDAAAPVVAADPTQMHQVLSNLCANACQAFEGSAGSIDIELESAVLDASTASVVGPLLPATYARLSVRDTGKGMDRATVERIFEPFFTTKGPDKGTGLGLAVVHGVILSHGGSIAVASETGRGTTFTIHLPAAATATAEVDPETKSAQDYNASHRGNGQRILYLDDDHLLVDLAARMLDRLGYRVAGFTDSNAALQALRESPDAYDLVITDMNMPGRTGLHVAREMITIRPTLPIVLSSGHVTDELLSQAKAAGVSEVLYKPNTVDEYAEAIQHLLRAGASVLR
jgi:PAS domain S-box-containing protein